MPAELTLAEIAAPYGQCWADARHSGTRHGPVHLYAEGNERTAVALCGRRVKLWNMEGETEEDFCPRCIRHARAVLRQQPTACAHGISLARHCPTCPPFHRLNP